jgi:hypothetical protein
MSETRNTVLGRKVLSGLREDLSRLSSFIEVLEVLLSELPDKDGRTEGSGSDDTETE